MTPKEKAKELIELYCQLLAIRSYENKDKAKQCALIAVDEILEMDLPILEEYADAFYDYWEEVKQEIDKL